MAKLQTKNSWAQVAAMPAGDNQKNAKEKAIQPQTHPSISNANNQKIKPIIPDTAAVRSLSHHSSKNQPGGSTRSQSGISCREGATSSVRPLAHASTSCNHCKLDGHEKGGCWFLHTHLRPKWWREGCGSKTPELKMAERENTENPKGEKRALNTALDRPRKKPFRKTLEKWKEGEGTYGSASEKGDPNEGSRRRGGVDEASGSNRADGTTSSRSRSERLDRLETLLSTLLTQRMGSGFAPSHSFIKGQDNILFPNVLGKTHEPKLIFENPNKCDKPINYFTH